MATRLKRLDPVDAAWYHLDRPVNETLVTGLVLTATPLSLARLRALIEQRLLPFARFRQRVVEYGFPMATPHWELDPEFDLDRHLHHVALPEPGDMPALFELVGDLVSTRLDHERPLWQVHLVDRVGQGSALVFRYHHCLADGTAMMALLSRICDREADAPSSPPPAPAAPGNWLDPILRPALQLVEQSSRVIDAAGRGVQQVTHPEQVLDQVRSVAAGVGTAVMAMLKPADPPSPLKGSLSGKRRVACSGPLPVFQLKAIGKATGAKVNDVLIAAAAGAIRQYLLEAGADPQRLQMRAVVPIDLRAPERALELGNAFGLTYLDLPVGVADPLERLARAKAGMDALKCSPEALVFLNILALFGQTPKPVEDIASDLFSSKGTVVLTNVVGPQQPLYLAGSRITRLSFFVPHPVSLGVGISLLSYNGEAVLSVISDAEVLAEPARISDRFASEVAALQARAVG